SVFLHSHAKFKERAIVLGVFLRYALRNWLRALKLPPGIEMNALFAAMHRGVATWAFAVGVKSGCQHRTAARAPRPHHRANHARRARAHRILFGARLAAGRTLASF